MHTSFVVIGVGHEGTSTAAQSSTAVAETVRAVPLKERSYCVMDRQRPDCLQGLADRPAQHDSSCCRATCLIAPGLPVRSLCQSHKVQHAKPGAARTPVARQGHLG